MNLYSLLCLIIIFFVAKVESLDNGLALTPPMGWMSWGYYMCADKCNETEKCLDEKLILSVVDSFFEDGYQEAGYEYVIIDDCWSEKQRGPDGRLVANKERFPRGMKFIADYIHKRGLKFGMYTNIAKTTCMLYPGSRGYFDIDAQTFAEWEIDYLKVDGCFVDRDYLNTAYINLGRYLNQTGRPMVYSCSWPYYTKFIHKSTPNYNDIQPYCNLWRNYHDVSTSWGAVEAIINYYQESYHDLAPFHGPGHWNDPDMLVFGVGVLTDNQSRVQLAVYAMLSAPLLLSCNMKSITKYEKELLQNLDLIAIAQDPLGIMAKPYKFSRKTTLWVKQHLPMKGDIYHSFSFALVNMNLINVDFSFTPGNYGLKSNDGYTILDVFTKKFIRNVTNKDILDVRVPGEDVVLYTLYPL